MYYSMNGTGSIGEAVLIDSQNPTAGSYDPVTHQPITSQPVNAPKWWEKLLDTTDKAIDAFNPNLKTGTPLPAEGGNPDVKSWIIPGLLVASAVGIAYYVTRPEKKSDKK